MTYLITSTHPKRFMDINRGVGEESKFLEIYKEKLLADYFSPMSRRWSNPTLRFYDLKDDWEENTAWLSSITEISMHPSYQQIIGMGPVAIPFIMYEMTQKPNHWFWALKSITGEDPVDHEQRGIIKDMTAAWIKWGQKQGYL